MYIYRERERQREGERERKKKFARLSTGINCRGRFMDSPRISGGAKNPA
jgi:hypothetical protein